MKEKRWKKVLIVCLLMVCFSSLMLGTSANASVVENVTKAQKANPGQWVVSKKGYRYRFTKSGTYAKNRWLKIGSHIYYFKADGHLQIGWKKYRGKKYHFGEQGTLTTGWYKVGSSRYYSWKADGSVATGKVTIAGKQYYFSKSGIMKTGWQLIGGSYYYFKPKNGSMAVNTIIGEYRVDKKGRRVMTEEEEVPEKALKKSGHVDYMVGDSRTVGLGSVTGTSSKCKALVGAGHTWCRSTALTWLEKKLKSNPTATVVLNFGVNDIDNYANYIASYRALMKKFPKANIYIMSVNPVDSAYNWGYYTVAQMKAKIKTFNKKMKAAFPDNYLDCHSHLVKETFTTVDGIHYTAATYKKIYQFILDNV
ncbi:MAG: hypothetical protein Q4B57_10710 [Eubacteriales bacterium]|nr:hypothetical protein [Eubacteriales bacterium]